LEGKKFLSEKFSHKSRKFELFNKKKESKIVQELTKRRKQKIELERKILNSLD